VVVIDLVTVVVFKAVVVKGGLVVDVKMEVVDRVVVGKVPVGKILGPGVGSTALSSVVSVGAAGVGATVGCGAGGGATAPESQYRTTKANIIKTNIILSLDLLEKI